MANYYFSDYVFEGKKNELDELEAMLRRLEAMKEEDFPIKDVDWGSTWLGFIVNDMGYDPEKFTTKGAWYNLKRLNDNALSIHMESAWSAPDDITGLFCEKWPSLWEYYYREQPESEIYEKWDNKNKYFPFNYILKGNIPMMDENGEKIDFKVSDSEENEFDSEEEKLGTDFDDDDLDLDDDDLDDDGLELEDDEEDTIEVEGRFNTEKEACEWITKELHHPVATVKDIEKWCEELNKLDDWYYIVLYKVE